MGIDYYTAGKSVFFCFFTNYATQLLRQVFGSFWSKRKRKKDGVFKNLA